LPCRRELADLWVWLAADVHGDDVFLTAAGGLAHLRAWLAADGHGGDVYFFAAAGGLAHLKAWLAAGGYGNEAGCNREYRAGRGMRIRAGHRECSLSQTRRKQFSGFVDTAVNLVRLGGRRRLSGDSVANR
jgi:hypothetical protein